ncbi:MAG: HEAT repeat domain-containing protein [Kiritimatiellia bacterium]
MKNIFLFVLILIGCSSACFGLDLSGVSDSNGVISITIDPAITGDEYTAASVATNLEASVIVRLAAIQTLAKNPTPHLNVLRTASRDPELAIRLAAAEALVSCDSAIAADTAKMVIQQLTATPPVRQGDNMFGLNAAALLAKLNDPSGFEFVVFRLEHAKFAAEKVTALAHLPEFRRFPEVPAGKAVVRFIAEMLPALEQEGTQARQEADVLLPRAFLALYHLRAVETLPQLKEWEKVLSGSPLRNLQYYMRGLEAYSNEGDTNAPVP